jgi:hypothetical protein
MNLSCSGRGLLQSGCLFFKVGGPTVYVTNGIGIPSFNFHSLLNLCFTAKFNRTVPGTLYDFIEKCNITTIPENTSAMVVTSVSKHIPTNIPPTYTSFGIPLLAYIIVIAVILIVSVTIICVVIRFKTGRNGQPNTPSSTVTASINTRPQEKSPSGKAA